VKKKKESQARDATSSWEQLTGWERPKNFWAKEKGMVVYGGNPRCLHLETQKKVQPNDQRTKKTTSSNKKNKKTRGGGGGKKKGGGSGEKKKSGSNGHRFPNFTEGESPELEEPHCVTEVGM